MMEKNPIDAVITWVDNGDVKHQNKTLEYLPKTDTNARQELRKRFIEVEEIKYVVHSILKYAPFIRKIFIVTDSQTPKFIKSCKTDIYSKVKIIDHKEIFKEDISQLPVFNSLSIETKLYKIPDLSELFIYFNDDFFLLNPVEKTDFFIDEKPVIRGKWKRFKEDLFYNKYLSKQTSQEPKHGIAQEKSAKIIGFKKLYKFGHTPLPIRVSTIKSFFLKNRQLELENITYKFRNIKQFLIQGIANHIEIKEKTCVMSQNYQLVSLTSFNKPLYWIYFKLNILSRNKNKLFLNIQELNLYKEPSKKFVLNWLENKYKL